MVSLERGSPATTSNTFHLQCTLAEASVDVRHIFCAATRSRKGRCIIITEDTDTPSAIFSSTCHYVAIIQVPRETERFQPVFVN